MTRIITCKAGIASIALCVMLCQVTLAQLPDIQTSGVIGQKQEVSEAMVERDREINSWLKVLQDPSSRNMDPEKLARAIERLGQLKAISAIDEIVKFLDFRRPGAESGPFLSTLPAQSTTYPAIGALEEFRDEALSSLALVIVDETAVQLSRENAIHAVTLIFRYRPSEGAYFMDNLARRVQSISIRNLVKEASSSFRQQLP